MRQLFTTLLALFIALSVGAQVLRPGVEELVLFETEGNAVAQRSSEEIRIRHYEIPLRLLEAEWSERLDPEARRFLVFEKNGEPHVRWVINPEDTRWHTEVARFLTERGIDATPREFFRGYMTASRSYIVQAPGSQFAFSVKVSTNVTGGNWRDKKQTWDDAYQVKLVADYVAEMMRRRAPQHFIYMDEPVAFGIKSLDQGMILRQLADLRSSDRYYMPGFSALHEAEGRHVANLNGASDPAKFWSEHYIRPLGRAIAELYAMTGLAYDSPHSQNFLVELDRDFKPTGRMVFRDLGDAYLTKEIPKILGFEPLAKAWEAGNVYSLRIPVAQGVLHGNSKPSWVSEATYDEFGRLFFIEFEKELSRLTKVSLQELFQDGSHRRSGDYFMKTYELNKPGWRQFLGDLEKYQVVEGVRLCAKAFVL